MHVVYECLSKTGKLKSETLAALYNLLGLNYCGKEGFITIFNNNGEMNTLDR